MRRRFQKNNTWLNRQLNKSGKIENLAGAASIKNEKIAVIYLEDGITSKVALKVVESLRKIKRDPDVKTVILRVNSPGGSSFASERILMECADLPQVKFCFLFHIISLFSFLVKAADNSFMFFFLANDNKSRFFALWETMLQVEVTTSRPTVIASLRLPPLSQDLSEYLLSNWTSLILHPGTE